MLTHTSLLSFRCRALICAICLLALAACGTAPQTTRPEAYTTRQNPIQSASAILAKAEGAISPERDRLLLRAAALFAEGNSPARAEEALKKVDHRALDIPYLTNYILQYADIALASERYLLARSLLGDSRLAERQDQIPPSQRRTWHRLRGDLYTHLGDNPSSVVEYVQLAALLPDSDRQAVHDLIWQTMGQMAEPQLRAGATSPDAVRSGWYRLALASRSGQGDIAHQLEQVEAWRRTNASHPAAQQLPTGLRQAAAAQGQLPKRLVLLLPLGGELAAAAEPLRDGFVAAYYAALGSGAKPPAIHIHDTSDGDISALYDQAVAEGAELVIGPLAKDRLQALVARPDLPVSVLGLNYIDRSPVDTNDVDNAPPHDNLYQYGLAVGDETHQLAERAWVEGRRSALVIRPEASWGTAAFDSFRAHWEQKGGLLLTTPPYRNDQPDYATFLRAALLLSDSEARATRLQRALGKKVSYIPRRRKDVDMVLLLAHPGPARQLKPTLDFLFASDLPIYATSHIYGGSPNPSQDQDLNGIRFTTLPWTIPQLESDDLNPQDTLAPAFRNLFAMGVDAYRLHQWLGLLRAMPDTALQGQTGSLTATPDGRIVRTLPLAVFHNGQVIAAPITSGVAQ